MSAAPPAAPLLAAMAAMRRTRAGWTSDNVAPLLLLAFVLCYNITESSILKYNAIFWLAYIVGTSLACGGGEVCWGRRRTAPAYTVPASVNPAR